MSKRICYNCKKGIMRGNKVSHAKNRSKKIFKPNLHIARIVVNGIKKKMLLCSKCIRKLKKKAKTPSPHKTLKA